MAELLQLRLYNTGFCISRETHAYRNGRRRKVALPVYAALMKHPDHGYILFDTGLATHYLDATQRFPARIMRWALPVDFGGSRHLLDQFALDGISVGDIRYGIASHLHNDHVAGMADFPDTQWYMRKTALAYMQGKNAFQLTLKGYIKSLVPAQPALPYKFIEQLPSGKAIAPFDVSWDFFGDGSINLVSLEGHARGQVGALLRLRGGRQVLLCADAIYLHQSAETGVGPDAIGRRVYDNQQAARHTLAQIHRFYQLNPDIPVLPAHCGRVAQLYPAYFKEMPVHLQYPVAGIV